MDPRKINAHVTVAPQISVRDVAAIKAAGFAAIVNNRPDHEENDQPLGTDIAAAAKAHGLSYYLIPVGRTGISPAMIKDMQAVLDGHDEPVFCYCRSGTRSAILWAKSQLGRMKIEDIRAEAAGAGYTIG